MKVSRIFAALLLTTFAATAANAQSVNIAWDGCTGPSDKAILPGTSVAIFASVLGQTQTAKSYQVQLKLATGVGALPDAWRFDAIGCQTAAGITIDHLTGSSKACPAFMGAVTPNFQLKDYTYNAGTGVAETFLANAYPAGGAGNPAATNPAQRYFLARWTFDHTYSVNGPSTPGETCGGLESAICQASVSLSNNAASWVNTNDQEVAWAFQNQFVTTNGHTGCPGATPAKATTWGNIKDQYKR